MAFVVRKKIEPFEDWSDETASETYERITGVKLSEHHMHDDANAIGQKVGILDVCPSKEYLHKKIEALSVNKFRRPIMMLALDGAHGPMRHEPRPHPPERKKRKRGNGKRLKGLGCISWECTRHVVQSIWRRVGVGG